MRFPLKLSSTFGKRRGLPAALAVVAILAVSTLTVHTGAASTRQLLRSTASRLSPANLLTTKTTPVAIDTQPAATVYKLDDAHDDSLVVYSVRSRSLDLAITVCRVRNLCIETGSFPDAAWRYWILRDDAQRQRVPTLDTKTLGDAFHRCVQQNSWPGQHWTLSIGNTSGAEWVGAFAFLADKFEPGNHPAAWLRLWSAFCNGVEHGRSILHEAGISPPQFFTYFLLPKESYQLNDWSQSVMEVASAVGHSAWTGSQDAGAPLPKYMDRRAIKDAGNASAGMTCFKDVITTKGGPVYFGSNAQADSFRQQAYRVVNMPLDRRRPRSIDEIDAVLLRRDRPIWNEDAVMAAFERAGLKARLSVVEFTPATPFAEQVGAMARADLVVSVHGSQLQNLVWMSPASAVIELFPHHFYHNGQHDLARSTGVNFFALRDNPLTPLEYAKKVRDGQRHWDRVSKKDSAATCMRDYGCRNSARSIGVMVNITSFEAVMQQAISAILAP